MKYTYRVVGNRITIGYFRFTVLSATCIRIERAPIPPTTSNNNNNNDATRPTQGETKAVEDEKVGVTQARDISFEDRPSQVFLHRPDSFSQFQINPTNKTNTTTTEDQRGVEKLKDTIAGSSEYSEGEGERDRERESEVVPFTIQTSSLTLQFFYETGTTVFFSESNLVILDQNNQVQWRYSEKSIDNHNLLGTTRTLDFQRVKGKPILEHGLICKDGYTIVDDSHSLVFNNSQWLVPRGTSTSTSSVAQVGLKPVVEGEYQDFYYFSYGQKYQQCLRDFLELAGSIPLVPKWALGLWWSKWHPYTQQELIDLVELFSLNKMPLTALCIDMDWHLVDVQKKAGMPSGWTGYTWNTKLIPSPPKLLEDLHQRGVRVALNLHPAEGCYPHEDAYKEFAQFMGIDPDSNGLICFDIGDPKFAEGYFKFLHHPHEAIGVDMWWIDWQQEDTTKVPSLTPIWWLGHLHHVNALNKKVRPLTYSRWGGLGSHRYPLGFSGDTVSDWTNLQMLPYITSTAANVCYNWWSHDIGGFMWGSNDPDLYIRWFQFGALSPVLRLHSTKNQFEEKLPWKYDKGTFAVIKDALRLRESLLPYIYSIAWRMYSRKDISFVAPTYYLSPSLSHSYNVPYQYLFGPELLVVPFVSKIDPETRLSRAVAWFPPGRWFAFESGEEYQGGQYQALYGKIDEIPIFAPAGAIVPLALRKIKQNASTILNIPPDSHISLTNYDLFEIRVFAGADHEFLMYDDDGETMEYQETSSSSNATTTLSQRFAQHIRGGDTLISLTFNVVPPTSSHQLKKRIYHTRIFGVTTPPVSIKYFMGDQEFPITYKHILPFGEIEFQPVYSDLTQSCRFVVEYMKEYPDQVEERITKQQENRLMQTISSFNTFAPIKSSIWHSVEVQSRRLAEYRAEQKDQQASHSSPSSSSSSSPPQSPSQSSPSQSSPQLQPPSPPERTPFDWIFTSGLDSKTSAFRTHAEMAAGCGSALFETPEESFIVLWNYNNIHRVSYECTSTDPAFSSTTAILPYEKVLVFSREFKQTKNCTVTVSFGTHWKDVYSIGIFASSNSNSKPVEKRKSFLHQIKKLF